MGALATTIGCLTIAGVVGGLGYYFIPQDMKEGVTDWINTTFSGEEDNFQSHPTEQESLAQITEGRSCQD